MSKSTSVYLSFLLRHQPEGLDMDRHGWVDVSRLIDQVNASGKYALNRESLEQIVATDDKGRYRFSEDGARIKACQGHSIPWVEPELEYREPPAALYHGTTMEAYAKIRETGGLSRMSRHAVHMHADSSMAWKAARRWRKPAVLLQINAKQMHEDGIAFGVSDNDVWCCDAVPLEYISAHPDE